VETDAAHMHVAWKGIFAPRPDGVPLTLDALRESVGGRLRDAPRFRQRLAFPLGGIAEPVWVDDESFDVRRHVMPLAPGSDRIGRRTFDELVDRALSEQLDRGRALWRILFAPTLEEGGGGLVMQAHHAMVDGKSAVELALLLLDLDPDAAPPQPDTSWRPEPAPGSGQLALEGGMRLADTLRRAALSVGEDMLRAAPSSYVNAPIGPRRTLVHHTADINRLLEVKTRQGVTLNDVALTVVAGALRQLAMKAGRIPQPLKVMVPVSVRDADKAAELGNAISFVFIGLPVSRSRPLDRLRAIHRETTSFKRGGRAAGGKAILDSLGLMPGPVRDRAAKLAASPMFQARACRSTCSAPRCARPSR